MMGNFFILLLTFLIAFVCNNFTSGKYLENPFYPTLTWCTTSMEEEQKCLAFAHAVDRDRESKFRIDYRRVLCELARNKDECMYLIANGDADVSLLDVGEVFFSERFRNILVPIMQEVYAGNESFYHSVAVVKRGTLPDVSALGDLRGKKACFPYVGSLAGWVIPFYTMMKHVGMEIIDCNNHVKSAINFFGPSCAANSNEIYNPNIDENSDNLCKLCIGVDPRDNCRPADPYYGFEGAFQCLIEAGEVAFLRHTTVMEMSRRVEFSAWGEDKFELLCRDGTRRALSDYLNCTWGTVPSHAVVTSSAKDGNERHLIHRFMKLAVKLYGQPLTNNSSADDISSKPSSGNKSNTQLSNFRLFDSAPYRNKSNLLFQDSAINVESLENSKQNCSSYLEGNSEMILSVKECPVKRMSLCVTSEPELAKCIKMKAALETKLLKPDMGCYKAHSQIQCMQAIRLGLADVTVLDAGDVYTAGYEYDLIPFIVEIYNRSLIEYYVVAVAKKDDTTTDLTNLKGKYTCHTGMNTAAGWVVPLAFFARNGTIKCNGCNSIRAAAEYFSKSCVPGANSTEYNPGVHYDNTSLCDLCHGAGDRYCRRDASEDYYGHSGALKCLVEGGGQVAFVKHTTVLENSDGNKKAWWDRTMLSGDFELLCPDGKRAQIKDYERCALSSAKSNAIVTRGGSAHNNTELRVFINLFLYAEDFYGREDPDDASFLMYDSQEPYSDLIFQDITTRLKVMPPEYRDYREWLGPTFLQTKKIADCYA